MARRRRTRARTRTRTRGRRSLGGLGETPGERQAQSAIGDATEAVNQAGRGACKAAFQAVLRAQGSSFYALASGVSGSSPLGQQASEAVYGAIDAFKARCMAKLNGLGGLRGRRHGCPCPPKKRRRSRRRARR